MALGDNPHEGEWGWDGYREGIDYPGRPDFGGSNFGVTEAKRFLPYVHSTTGNATLIHKVRTVKLRWYQGHCSYMKRLSRPVVYAETICGMTKFLEKTRNGKLGVAAKMCKIPDPNAVLCGTCHGELPTFSKKRKNRIKKRWAKDHLGCKGIVEVIGPYEPPKSEPAAS